MPASPIESHETPHDELRDTTTDIPEDSRERLRELRDALPAEGDTPDDKPGTRDKKEDAEKDKPVEATVEVAGDAKRHNAVQIHLNLGAADQKAINFDPSKAGEKAPTFSLKPGTHTIDVQSRKAGTGSTFRVVVDGKKSTPQSAPFPVTVTGKEKILIIVEEPVGNQKEPVKLDDGEKLGEKCPVTIRQPGGYNLPYAVDIYDPAAPGKPLQSIVSNDGKVPAGLASLNAGKYLVHIRPLQQHYPQNGRVSVVGGDKRSDGFRQANLARNDRGGVGPGFTEVVLKAGQTLEVEVEEPTESYNQVMRSFKDVPVNVVFNNPYLASNNGPGGKFSPNPVDKYPNTILAIMEEGGWKPGADVAKVVDAGAEKISTAFAQRVAKGIMATKDKTDAINDYRFNHVTFLFGKDKDGKPPRAFVELGEEKLAQELAPVMKAMIVEVMAKPHRTSDAMGIQGQADQDKEVGSKVKAGTPLHYTKNQAISDYGPAYMKRWEARKAAIKKEDDEPRR